MTQGGRSGAGWLLVLLAAAALLAGCAGLPADPPRTMSVSQAAPSGAPLARIAAASLPDAEKTGFRLLPTPEFSLDARLELARRATSTLDVQYYHLHDDRTGRHVLRLLRDAASRGVRVRLLIDDLHTFGQDKLLSAFAAHDKVEVRLFNPFPIRGGGLYTRYLASLFDFRRLNHRMHNKLFIADGVMAVIGGRNIGDEYFLRDAGANFLDVDALVVGSLSARLGSLFDEYWNSRHTYPLHAIVRPPAGADALRAWFDQVTGAPTTGVPDDPPAHDLLGYEPTRAGLAAGKLSLAVASAEAFADSPDKVGRSRPDQDHDEAGNARGFLAELRRRVRSAEFEVMETSPYLVPGPEGMQSIRMLRERGVRFGIVTNSLAATDEPSAFSGYRRYRRQLLELGVELFEISPARVRGNNDRFGSFGDSVGRLHAKSAAIDRKTVYIGSLNFDPRSDRYNTEMGIIIHSPDIAEDLLKLMSILREDGSYRVRFADDGSKRLQWVENGPDGKRIFDSEPETTPWQQLLLEMMTVLTPEHLL